MIRLATDVGGTFTDLVAFDETTGAVFTAKTLTTPQDQSRGVLAAIAEARELHGLDPAAVAYFVHGGTAVINAVTERKGVMTALVTTRGFRDVLEIGRGNRPDLYNLRSRTPPPFVPRALRFEVGERVAADGTVVTPLAEGDVARVAEACRAAGVEALAIVFLHSYRAPAHEERAARLLREALPGVTVCASCEVSREWREYERSSTAVLNAYVQPIVRRYLSGLADGLTKVSVAPPHHAMLSSGGVASFAQAMAQPLTLLESGPAGGAAGAARIARALGSEGVIYLDVGGTTAKCCLVGADGPETSHLYHVEKTRLWPGYPVQAPVVDIVEIGAGGGSIVGVDAQGRLSVGPRSAGADPGPVCYGRGGTQPTLTDAAVVLGHVDPATFAAGRMRLDRDGAVGAYEALGRALAMDARAAAEAAFAVASANMINALKLVTVQRGHDPRKFRLVVSGGAGPLFAAALGRALGVRGVVIPPWPGIFSAWGMLAARPRAEARRTVFLPLDENAPAAAGAVLDELTQEARRKLDDGCDITVRHSLDMRYRGQEHSVVVPCVPREPAPALAARFHAEHERSYSFRLDGHVVEITHASVAAERDVALIGLPVSPQGAAPEPRHRGDGWTVWRREALPGGFSLEGPALVEEGTTTTVIPPGDRATVTKDGLLLVERAQAGGPETGEHA